MLVRPRRLDLSGLPIEVPRYVLRRPLQAVGVEVGTCVFDEMEVIVVLPVITVRVGMRRIDQDVRFFSIRLDDIQFRGRRYTALDMLIAQKPKSRPSPRFTRELRAHLEISVLLDESYSLAIH